jgi:uncharacterized protein YxjI
MASGSKENSSPASEKRIELNLSAHPHIAVKQVRELAELFGFETRNKYQILSGETAIGYAAEQQKSLFGFLFRQALGHWRTYDILIFDMSRQIYVKVHHPFRFFFHRLEVTDSNDQSIGAIQQRFAIFSKSFDLEDPRGKVILEMRSPFWKFWTFPFTRQGRKVAVILKKWSGALYELFTDRDNFYLEFSDASLKENDRQLLLAAALFIDLRYFERKARSNG